MLPRVLLIASVLLSPLAGAQIAGAAQTIGATGSLQLRYAENVAAGPSGRVYVLDTSGSSPDPRVLVKVFTPAGKGLRSWHVGADADIFDIAIDAAENVFVAVRGQHAVLKYSSTGELLATLALPGARDRIVDLALAFDPAGNLVVAESDGAIAIFDAAGKLVGVRKLVVPGQPSDAGIGAIAIGPSGAAYVSTAGGIGVLDSAGVVTRYVARSGPRPQDLSSIRAIAAGPANSVYVLSSFGIQAPTTPRVQQFAADGTYLGSAALDRHFSWTDVAVAPDGSILASAFVPGPGDGLVTRADPITAVDVTPPKVAIASVRTRPLGSRSLVLTRLRYTLSERSTLRITLSRRADRGRYEGRYRQAKTINLAPVRAGTHTFDWRARTASLARLRRGRYKVFVVASDTAGLDSPAARASFTLGRR